MKTAIHQGLEQLLNKQNLSPDVMRSCMQQILQGDASDSQISAFLIALRMKGETVAEITAATELLRELLKPVDLGQETLMDTCGTGGDGSKLFNVSTACAFIVAASGEIKVAKHGNRSVSSNSGSSDLLEAAGVNLQLTPAQIAHCIKETGLGFMFAPAHHSALRHAVTARREIATKTLFNLLGPLLNPARTQIQMMGVFSKQWLRPIAEVLNNLGSQRVLVVHSEEGLDEISLAAPTHVVELNHGVINEYSITPEQFGIQRQPLAALSIDNAEQSLQIIKDAFSGKNELAVDMLALNAGAACYVGGVASSLAEGVTLAQDIIGSGAAKIKMEEFIQFTQMVSQVPQT